MTTTKPRLTIIIGPTASGKTNYGIELAKKTNGAVISADSRQVYAGMNVGTATPLRHVVCERHDFAGQAPHDILTPDAIQGIDHYLFNIRTPDNPLTLSEWQAAAFEVIDYIASKQKHPIIVGGTMLYIDSVVHNYDIPHVPANMAFRAGKTKVDTKTLYEELIKRDPKAQQFIEPHNTRRIIRALEVIDATGEPFSVQRRARPPRYNCELIGLFSSWDDLRDRITRRAKKMLREGLLEETKTLQRTYGKNLPLLQTMNCKQAADALAGKITKQQALEEMVRVNMRYAHRQMSWWHSRSNIRWICQ